MMNLSNCEKKVLAVVYENAEPMALQEIMRKVNAKFNREWKPQTVSTFLSRLVKKEYLSGTREGRLTYYSPILTYEEYKLKSCKEMCDLVFNGDASAFKALVEKM